MTVEPPVAGDGLADTVVDVDVPVTVSVVDPCDPSNGPDPPYEPDTVSAPTGAAVEVHEPLDVAPEAGARVAEHKKFGPAPNWTLPEGAALPLAADTVAL